MGFSLGEILLLVVVGIIVVGPKRLPGLMRTAGQWIARLRRMSSDLRSQSGIDDLLRQEGLDQHIHELRSLSRLNVVESLMRPPVASAVAAAPAPLDTPAERFDRPKLRSTPWPPPDPVRDREYPLVGCDAHGALPDDSPYVDDAPPAPAPSAQAPAAPAEAAPSDEPAAEAEGRS